MSATEPSTITVNSLRVRDLEPSPIADEVRSKYEAAFGEPPREPGGWYRIDDWRRTSFVLDQLRSGDRLLDVGAGQVSSPTCWPPVANSGP